MKKLISMLLAVLMVCSITIPAWAAPVEDAIIDTTRTGSINIYKYDLTNAEKDGVWNSSYVSTGIRDENGVETILGNPERISHLNENGDAYGYALKGVEFSVIKVADNAAAADILKKNGVKVICQDELEKIFGD